MIGNRGAIDLNLAGIMRWSLAGIGLLVVFSSFRSHAAKKMTSDLATAWCLVGLALLVIGAVPPLSRWLNWISGWTGVALFCLGAVCLWAAFRICLILSRLATQNLELAMQVSLLLGAHQELPDKPAENGESGQKEGAGHEESLVCH